MYTLLDQYLKTGYTPANLAILFSLKNYNAQRLYDLIRVWSGTKQTINYKIEDIKMYLMLEDSYPQYSNFKRRVILPAIKELNESGFFEIDIKENKSGRKVESIDFIVKDLDKRKYFSKDDVIDQIGESNIYEQSSVPEPFEENKINLKLEKSILNREFFVPDETVFTKGTLRSFKMDFENIDFKNDYMKKAFDDAVMITLDKDDVETIKAVSYKFFKGTLDNKILEYKKECEEDLKHKEEMDLFW
ncbi:replication initiation protein [Paraclostridium sp. AKS46]|nr:replication initiation protein [Paraclostridium sp. AKS46]